MSTTTTAAPACQSTRSSRQTSSMHWLTRHFFTAAPCQGKDAAETLRIAHVTLERPHTAPSAGTSARFAVTQEAPPVPRLPPNAHLLPARYANNPRLCPSQFPRPEAVVIQDVNAWLHASGQNSASPDKPAEPLMGRLSYWKGGSAATCNQAAGMQYAVPIVQKPDTAKSAPSHGQQIKAFCRRAKKIHVRMPTIRKAKNPPTANTPEDIDKQSLASPLVAISYEETKQSAEPFFLTRMGTTRRASATRPSTAQVCQHGYATGAQASVEELPLLRGSPSIGGGNTLRPIMTGFHLPREDSMGSFSSAPTYFSGPPPPSYRSRTASILTTSSFGCIDGMNSEQRQRAQEKAQRKRGMKGRLRKLAEKANLTR